MEVEKNRTVIVPASHSTTTIKPIGAATRIDLEWIKHPGEESQQDSESENRTSQFRRSSYKDKPRSSSGTMCFRLADLVMDMVIIFPLVIAFWRGVWELMHYHSKEWGIDPWLSMGLGYSIPLVLHLFQEPLKRHVSLETMSFPTYYLVTRTLLLIHSVGSVNQWRGLWAWLDEELALDPWGAGILLAIGIFFSIILRTLNNILAPPLFCFVDESVHDCSTRFRTSPTKPCQYFLDCAFTTIIIPAFVVFCWRGLWTLADVYLFPSSETQSAMASTCVGYTLSIILCVAQPWICERARNLKGMTRIAFMDIINIFGFVGVVLAWRGVWNSYNIFLVFETQNLSEWITTIVGALGTMILGCISTVLVKGIALDGELPKDDSAEWLIPYISELRKPLDHNIFQEPWLCRRLCMAQRVQSKRRRQEGKDTKLDMALVGEGDKKVVTKPLKLGNAITNSVHPTIPAATAVDDYVKKNMSHPHPVKNNRFRLSDLPNIDSSSEEELGMRTTMIPQPDDANTTDNYRRSSSIEQK